MKNNTGKIMVFLLISSMVLLSSITIEPVTSVREKVEQNIEIKIDEKNQTPFPLGSNHNCIAPRRNGDPDEVVE